MTNDLLIISIDALNAKDYNHIKTLPLFKDFIEKGSHIREVEAVYPSLTYCCHTSILTGCYPGKHGIFHNEQVNPRQALAQDWFWFAPQIQVPTLFDLAHRAGLKTGSVLWPVMAGNPSITYNIPEIFSNKGESSFKLFFKYGSKKLLPLVLKHAGKLEGTKQPALDYFTESVAVDLITKKAPHLLAVHFTELDSARHYNGVFSSQARAALDQVQERINSLLSALKKTGRYEKTNIVLLGDHGGNDFHSIISLNSLFKDHHLLEDRTNGEITDWQVYANSAGGSVHIHLKEPNNNSLYKQVDGILQKLYLMPDSPIKSVIHKKKAQSFYHLDGPFDFILEAKDGYIFKNDTRGPWLKERDPERHYLADHGHLPSHPNLKTLLFAKGPDIAQGQTLAKADLVDQGPTFARLLGLTFPSVDGQVLETLLSQAP